MTAGQTIGYWRPLTLMWTKLKSWLAAVLNHRDGERYRPFFLSLLPLHLSPGHFLTSRDRRPLQATNTPFQCHSSITSSLCSSLFPFLHHLHLTSPKITPSLLFLHPQPCCCLLAFGLSWYFYMCCLSFFYRHGVDIQAGLVFVFLDGRIQCCLLLPDLYCMSLA